MNISFIFRINFKLVTYTILCMHRMLLTKYLAETGEDSEIAGIIAISALWDPPVSNVVLEQFPNKQLYNWFLSRKLRNMVQR